jgi:hypothetical protein
LNINKIKTVEETLKTKEEELEILQVWS